MLGPSLVVGRCGWIAWCEGVTDVSVHSCETSCLSMRVEGHVGGYISVPARTQISWDLIPTDIDGDPQSVGPGLVDPAADDRVIPRMFQDVQVIATSPVWLIACSAKCPGLAFPFRVVVQLALSG